jgi:hypothetical protein
MAKKAPRRAQEPTSPHKASEGSKPVSRKVGGVTRRESQGRKATAGRIVQAARIASATSRPRTGSVPAGTVTMQARVDADFARELVEADAPVLGLDGTSALVREGLRLVHKRARELAMAEEYDKFYGEEPAPLPDGVAAIWAD